jgi:hypothetical protein
MTKPFSNISVWPSQREDVVYKDYFIAKGSLITLNQWYAHDGSVTPNSLLTQHRAIHHDPELYPDPEEFKTDRFVGNDLTAGECISASEVRNRDHLSFGPSKSHFNAIYFQIASC